MKIFYSVLLLMLGFCILGFFGLTPIDLGDNVSYAMFTVCAFAELGTAAAAYVNIAGVVDQHMTVNGDQIIISKWNKLLGVAAFPGAACTGVQLQAPSLREINPFRVAPFGVGIAPGLVPEVNFFPMNSIQLTENEAIECEHYDGAASNHAVLVMLADSEINPLRGDIRQVRFQVTVTPVDLVWTNANIALVDYLPYGDYAIVGARFIMAGGAFFRFVAKEQGNRPGGCCVVLPSNQDAPYMRNGELGEWLTFNTNNLPTIDVLTTTTPGAGTYEGVMDIVRVG